MARPISFPQTKVDYYAMRGGLDLMTPAIAIDPGKCFDAQNYVPEISGGYRRWYGHERFDGRSSPTAAPYWIVEVNASGALPIGATLTGVMSTATGRILAVSGATVVLGRVAGDFQPGETLLIGGDIVGSAIGLVRRNAASVPSDDADFKLLAANDQRLSIGIVPGSGPIRGVIVYRDVVYAFRDNLTATAGDIYKATAAGWVKVPLAGIEIQFKSATAEIKPGDIVVGGTSGAQAVVKRATLRSGTWILEGAGTLGVTVTSGTFATGEALKVSNASRATSTSGAVAIARKPGGRLELVIANFTGAVMTRRVYGADGVNPAFEFDGTDYLPIYTGMATDTPLHITSHANRLFLSFGASVQYSQAGAPFSWSAVVGAGEIATGSEVTGFKTQSGSAAGSALAIFTRTNTPILYGSSNGDFQLVPSQFELGYAPYTIQAVGNKTYGLTARGIQALGTTQEYGNFLYASVSFLVQSLMNRKRGLETASTVMEAAGLYWLYFTDGTAIVVGLTGDKITGIMPMNQGKVVRCITTQTLTTGEEVTYFGSDDGFVYQEGVGTSFDGKPIEAWVRPAFNNVKSPQLRKQFRRAFFEFKGDGYCQLAITYDLGYANPDVSQSIAELLTLLGSGGYWDQATWDEFTWDNPVVDSPSVSIDGVENNIAFLFYSNRAQDQSSVVQGVSLHYTPRRLSRG